MSYASDKNNGGNEAFDLPSSGAIFFKKPVEFVKSVPQMSFLPDADRPEVAFVGRSNVGKSSLLNALANQNNLARVSNTPGRTRELNYFSVSDGTNLGYIVDLPGYGYAKAPKTEIARWTELILDYLAGRASLRRVFLLVDSRHGIKKNDEEVFTLLDKVAVSYQIVLTKIDKVKPAEREKMLERIALSIQKRPAAMTQVLFSSSKEKTGLETIRDHISWVLGQ